MNVSNYNDIAEKENRTLWELLKNTARINEGVIGTQISTSAFEVLPSAYRVAGGLVPLLSFPRRGAVRGIVSLPPQIVEH